MSKKKKDINITDLPFVSILDRRPKAGQFILIGWDIQGYCGYESVYWDNSEEKCKHCVVWCPLDYSHVFTRRCALVLRRHVRPLPTILKWSKHFSFIKDNKYISKDKMPKIADTL